MSLSSARLWTSMSLLVLATACGGGLSKDEFCDEYAKAYCATSDACCEGGRDVEACEDGFGSFCAIASSQFSDDEFDGDAAQECIDAINASKDSCDPGPGFGDDDDSPCNRVFPEDEDDDSAGEGESCADDFCDDGLYCDFSGGEICKKETEVGGDCTNAQSSCADGSRCTSTGTGTTRVCQAGKAAGEACQTSFDCASSSCGADGLCAPEEHPSCLITFK